MSNLKVNAWTEWGKLKTVVVGRADMACYKGQGIDNKNTVNDPELAKLMDWPVGKVKQCRIDKANEELDNFAKVLESRGIKVLRPKPFDFSEMVKTPHWSSPHHFCAACPRDVMITLVRDI
jgi:glycine amidinotransferase